MNLKANFCTIQTRIKIAESQINNMESKLEKCKMMREKTDDWKIKK